MHGRMSKKLRVKLLKSISKPDINVQTSWPRLLLKPKSICSAEPDWPKLLIYSGECWNTRFSMLLMLPDN